MTIRNFVLVFCIFFITSCYSTYINGDEKLLLHSNGNWDFKRNGKRLNSGNYEYISTKIISVSLHSENIDFSKLPIKKYKVNMKFIDSLGSEKIMFRAYENVGQALHFFGLEVIDKYNKRLFSDHGGVIGELTIDSKFRNNNFRISYTSMPTILINGVPIEFNCVEIIHNSCNYEVLSGLHEGALFRTELLINEENKSFEYVDCDL